MNKALLKPEIQDYIKKNLKEDLSKIVLKGSPFPEVSSAELAQQIFGLKTAQKKLPTWFNSENIIYPPKINLEQTSSEITAQYKTSLIQGSNLIDLTGGFGIDDYFFAQNFAEVIHCEMNPELSEIAQHNFKALDRVTIECKCADSVEILKNSTQNFDAIYLDPARRDDHGGKVFRLADCVPNVPENLELLFSKSKTILIKTSPLLDLKAGIEELKQVSEIHIVAVNNEVKELVWLLQKDYSGEVEIKTINFQKNGNQEFSGLFNSAASVNFSKPQKYLYEPNAAIMKSGLFDLLAEKTATNKLHQNSHLYTSEKLKLFPGRIFQIIDLKEYKPSILNKKFNYKKANITTRNFPETVAVLRKKFKIKDGGKSYIFFTTNPDGKKIVVECEKV